MTKSSTFTLGHFAVDTLKQKLERTRLWSHLSSLNRKPTQVQIEPVGKEVTNSERHYRLNQPCTHLSLLSSTNENLRVLDVSKCSLRQFCANLPNLQVLNLSGNRLSDLTQIFTPNLIHFDVSENRLARYDAFKFNLPLCHFLNASGNQLGIEQMF